VAIHSGEELSAVSCSSPRACTAVGDGLTQASTGPPVLRWSGTKWSIQQSAKPGAAKYWTFAGVSCPSATDCIAVGRLDTKTSRSEALAERWDGSGWRVLPISTPDEASKRSELSGVSCTSPRACTAVGDYGNYRSLVERWNGSTWSTQRTPKISRGLTGVSCISQRQCTAVGDNGDSTPIVLRWAAGRWSLSEVLGSGEELFGVSCASATVCTAVGDYSAGSGSFQPVLAQWDGMRWTDPSLPLAAFDATGLYGVACTSARACTAVGDFGTALEWNGSQWTAQRTPNRSVSLFGVSCTKKVCVAVGATVNASPSRLVVERRS
jgi:hypothetical protein